MYNDAGHFIANHTHDHANFNKRSLEEFKRSFQRADQLLSSFSHFKKWFRFPYLREGNSEAKRNGMREVLKNNNYINAYITMNNYDWYIESLFQKALKNGKKIDFNKLKFFYISTMMESINYYDNLAKKHLGRSPKHVLLLHEMDITALFISDLINELRQNNWKIISPTEAYSDPIFNYQSKNVFPHNPGRIGEIAKDNGQTKNLWHKTLDEKYLENKFENSVLK